MAEFSHICCSPSHRPRNHDAVANTVAGKEAAGDTLHGAGSDGLSHSNAQDKPAAMQFDFELDGFQKAAIECLEKRESVLVSAHTSAGKTVVAQYAMAMAIRDHQRVIYTTPIKALSNQKFRDLGTLFAKKFTPSQNSENNSTSAGDVGLMTGDVTVNQDATCLVMTTEILRSMLYHGADALREVSWVVFDEVHYLRDKERGVVWEESIILLPPTIKLVFLSATIPNAIDFAQWIAELKRQPCHVISTDFRPTPLHHYMFPAGGKGLYLIMDEKGNFQEEIFLRMIDAFDQDVGAKKGTKGPSDIQKVVGCVIEQQLQPAIVFSFSRRECEALAMQLSRSKRFNLNGPDEAKSIQEVFDGAIACLSEADQGLPQIKLLLPLLLKGIGVHHSGLLPILREVVEILFQEGLIRILFATETFALGLNMPAKTCIFTSCRKFDGQEQRWLTSAEYIQMAGRAGRRGIDDRGVVITILDTRLDPQAARGIVCGRACPLSSTFHLSYNMLLNAMRSSTTDPEAIISRSFYQFQHAAQEPALLAAAARLRTAASAAAAAAVGDPAADNAAAAEHCEWARLHRDLEIDVARIVAEPAHCLKFLSPGRVVRIVEGGSRDWGWGCVLGFQRRTRAAKGQVLPPPGSADAFVCDILLPAATTAAAAATSTAGQGGDGSGVRLDISPSSATARPLPFQGWLQLGMPGQRKGAVAGEWVPGVFPFLLSDIRVISSVRVYLPADLRPVGAQVAAVRAMYKAAAAYEGGDPPRLDPVREMGIAHSELPVLLQRLELMTENLRTSKFRTAHLRLLADGIDIAAPLSDAEVATCAAAAEGAANGDDKVDKPKDLAAWAEVAASEAEGTAVEVAGKDRSGEGGDGDRAAAIADAAAADGSRVLLRSRRRLGLLRAAEGLERRVKESRTHGFRDELRARARVLRRLQYVTEAGAVTVKGRVACEVELCEDLALAEMVMAGAFSGAAPEDIAAVLTCQVAEEREEGGGRVQEVRLGAMLEAMRTARATLAAAEREAGLSSETAVAPEINTSMMDVMHMWCSGAEFAELCARSKMFEGSIVRVMRRLAELLRQLELGAAAVGDEDLQGRFAAALGRLQRGLPFSSSLYI